MPEDELDEERIKQMDKKELRKEFPSGWMKLTRYETNVILIDTLLQEPANREFNSSELADLSGASKRSVDNRIGDLVELGVVTELPNRDQTRYRLNNQSPIVRKLNELNTTVKRVEQSDLEKSVSDLDLTSGEGTSPDVGGLRKGDPTSGGFTVGNKYAN